MSEHDRARPDRPAGPHLLRRWRAGVCERCGANVHVHRQLCRRCRRVLLGEGRVTGGTETPPVHQASPPGLHNPPWRRHGA